MLLISKQQSLGLLAFESTFKCLPAGAEPQTLYSRCSRILPFLEQGNLCRQFEHGQERSPVS
ncbi:DUF1559 domain-containing protein [Planctomycetaceae bacterium SH139]